MSLEIAQRHPLMCLTQDALPLSHEEQARRLCAAGARWIQLRMKNAERARWLATARAVVTICRAHGAVCVINDDVEIAIASDAHGVHLGKRDLGWREARRRLGPEKVLGGTVNDAVDASRALATRCLDYVGVGPWRFTPNKENLAPVLGPDGVRTLVAQLGGLPAWAIGGIEAADLAAVHASGVTGAALSTALFRDGGVEDNVRGIAAAWGSIANESRS